MARALYALGLVGLLGFGCTCRSSSGTGGSVAVPSVAQPAASAAPPVTGPLMTSTDVDVVLQAEWLRAGVKPTPPADDATFLRRATIDLTGRIPTPEAVVAFLADAAPGKRERAVDALLASPAYADFWTAYWDDLLMGEVKGQDVDPGAFRGWLHDQLARGTPWNAFVTALLTASGQNSAGGARRDARMSPGTEGPDEPAGDGPINGAVNWTLKYQQAPQDLAGSASRAFLGVQIQCAQCHDHKTEKWKQEDFQRFAAAFMRTRLVPIDKGKAMGLVKRVEVRDLDRAAPRFDKMGDLRPIIAAKPTALDGTDLTAGPSVRQALAAWMTSPKNPWFARAFVNRMWGHLLGRGFVNPVDDLRPANPPTAGPLLDRLADDFVASGYDVKHVLRLVAGTEAYRLSTAPLDEASAKGDPEAKLWERFRMTPLGPDELLDALTQATGLDAMLQRTGRDDLDQVRFKLKRRYGFLFDVDEEADRGDFEGTITQALALLNGSVVASGASVLPGSALEGLLAGSGGDEQRLEALYLRVLSRRPTAEERATWVRYISDAVTAEPPPAEGPKGRRPKGPKGPKPPVGPQQPDPLRGLENRAGNRQGGPRAQAYEDILWTLLNSSEFTFNH